MPGPTFSSLQQQQQQQQQYHQPELLPFLVLAVVVVGVFARVFPGATATVYSTLASFLETHESNWWDRDLVDINCAVATMSVPELCSQCSRPAAPSQKLLRCSRCKRSSVRYCGAECQRLHWKNGHKDTCRAPRNGVAPTPQEEQEEEERPSPQKLIYDYANFLHMFRSADPRVLDEPAGLVNCGNTCFANSTLQCLLATPPLVAFFTCKGHKQSCRKPRASAWCLLCELEDMFVALQSDTECINPMGLMKRIKQLGGGLTFGKQEDAHEFFIRLVEVAADILIAEAGGKKAFSLRSQETTFLHHLFGCYIRNETQCEVCGYRSKSFQAELGFQLELTRGVRCVDDALGRHFADECLDEENQWRCAKCKRAVESRKMYRLETAPNALVLTLKRFSVMGTSHKINRHIQFDTTLNLGPHLADGSPDLVPATYTLYGVLVHLSMSRSLQFGHYVSCIRNRDGTWSHCDDSRIRPTSEAEVLSQPAYMLFYQRDEPRTGPAAMCPHPSSLTHHDFKLPSESQEESALEEADASASKTAQSSECPPEEDAARPSTMLSAEDRYLAQHSSCQELLDEPGPALRASLESTGHGMSSISAPASSRSSLDISTVSLLRGKEGLQTAAAAKVACDRKIVEFPSKWRTAAMRGCLIKRTSISVLPHQSVTLRVKLVAECGASDVRVENVPAFEGGADLVRVCVRESPWYTITLPVPVHLPLVKAKLLAHRELKLVFMPA